MRLRTPSEGVVSCVSIYSRESHGIEDGYPKEGPPLGELRQLQGLLPRHLPASPETQRIPVSFGHQLQPQDWDCHFTKCTPKSRISFLIWNRNVRWTAFAFGGKPFLKTALGRRFLQGRENNNRLESIPRLSLEVSGKLLCQYLL